jgi:hypothetical protein
VSRKLLRSTRSSPPTPGAHPWLGTAMAWAMYASARVAEGDQLRRTNRSATLPNLRRAHGTPSTFGPHPPSNWSLMSGWVAEKRALQPVASQRSTGCARRML